MPPDRFTDSVGLGVVKHQTTAIKEKTTPRRSQNHGTGVKHQNVDLVANLDNSKDLVLDFQEAARNSFNEVTSKLLSKYEAALRDLQEARHLLKAHRESEKKVTELVEPLRQENYELKIEIERLRNSGIYGSFEDDDAILLSDALLFKDGVDKGMGICTVNSEAVKPPAVVREMRRLVVFLDLSPECDDECALLYILSECNNSHLNAKVDLIVPDTVMRFHWLAYLFEDKLALGGGWNVSEDGSSIVVNNVTVNLWLAPSSKETMVVEDFKKKLGDKFQNVQDVAQTNLLRPRLVDDCPGGDAGFMLMAAPVPELPETFFERFGSIGTSYVVGTPGGVNCPQPSWSKVLYSLHRKGPVIYLSPQFTREVRFPRDYVEENPHWTWYMKETVFDSALTVMARRPEIPAKFGDWGLVLRLNAANAKVNSSWYSDVMGKPIELDNCQSRFKSMVSAYVERNSGEDRKLGGVVNELKLLGVELDMEFDDSGQPATPEDMALLREKYREELFKAVYTCVATTETLLFSHQSNFKFTGENGIPTLLPRCGYADAHDSLAKIFGISDAVEILRSLPLKSLTPAYDMVGAICALDFIKTQELDDVTPIPVEVKPAAHELSTKLFESFLDQVEESPYGVFTIGQQTTEVVDNLVNLLHLNVSTDPLLIIDEFWARLKHDVNKAGKVAKPGGKKFSNHGRGLGSLRNPMDISASSAMYMEGSSYSKFTCVWHPASVKEALWSLISMLLIVCDCVLVPLLFFGVEESSIQLLIFTIWWTLDLIHNFSVGFYVHGVVESRPSAVARRYFHTWFSLDAFLVVADWISLCVTVGDHTREMLRFLRLLRGIRLVRLSQFSKIDRVLQPLGDILPGRRWIQVFIKFMKVAFVVLIVNHFIACIWYYIGLVSDRQAIPNWLELSEDNLTSGTMLYLTCLHWSLAHLMLEEIDVYPVNIPERIFSMIVLGMGMVVFSSFVSSITELLTRMASASAENSRRDSEVRKYMEDHNVSATLTMMIDRYRVESRRKAAIQVVPLDQIEGLADLPETLAIQLSCEVFGNTLQNHGFFKVLQTHYEMASTQAIYYMMSEAVFAPRKEIFIKGLLADTVMILAKGRFGYSRENYEVDEVAACQWVSEPALWLNGWKRRGYLESRTSMEVHVLDIGKFQETAQKIWDVGTLGCHFAELVAHLKIPFAELHDLQVDMETRSRLAYEALALSRPTD